MHNLDESINLKIKSVKPDKKLLKLLKDNFDAYRITGRKFPQKAIKYAEIERDKLSKNKKT